jgi:hypothetical protein
MLSAVRLSILKEAVGGHWRAALGQEEVARSHWLLALDPPQRAYFDAAQRLHAIVAALAPDYLQPPGFEIHLLPPQRDQLAQSEPMPVR